MGKKGKMPGEVRPALCLDLDGTIRYSKSGEFIYEPDDVALYPGVEETIWQYRDRGYLIFGISNQGAAAMGYKTIDEIEAETEATIRAFESNPFHFIKLCYHHPRGKVVPLNRRSLLRKPEIGMLALCEAEAWETGCAVDWDNSLFVGDRPEDEECAKRAGIEFVRADRFFGRTD